MDMDKSKDTFLEILRNLEEHKKLEFLQWISSQWSLNDLCSLKNEDAILNDIAEEIREFMPLSGVLPSENIYEPVTLSKEERDTTAHIDEFLYNADELDKLVEAGKLSLHRCEDCGSKNVKPLTLISHSCSLERLRFIFNAILPPLDSLTFLDVGSRFGAVLFGAFVLSSAKRICGVELNGDLCRLGRGVLERRQMLERVELVHADICSQDELVAEADVVLVSNAFEYFADTSEAVKCWRYLYRNLKTGATLVLSPRAEVTFKMYNIGVPPSDWLTEMPLHNPDAPGISDWDALVESMAAYRVSENKPALQH